jgi:hypothetical protein
MAYEYPFNTFPLANKVRILNPAANLDARYGPWTSLSEALSATEGVRQTGLTVAVSSIATGVVEYHFKNGIADNNLVIKIPEIANITGYLPTSGGNITGNLSVSGFLSGANLDFQNNIQIEGDFLSSRARPQGNVVFRDVFTEVSNRELTLHTPNLGNNWTRIYETNINTRLTVIGGQNEIKSIISPTFQGVIYQANASFITNNHEVKVLCKEISPVDTLNFDVFWLLSRIQDVNNFYAVRFGVQSNDCAIYKKVAGTFTLLKQLNINFPSRFDFYVSLRVHGNSISVFINDNFIDSVIDTSLIYGAHGIGIGNIGVRGNDSVDTNTRLTDFTITLYNGFEKDSYINQNNFGVGTKTPNEKLTVSGNISSNNLIYSLGGNSQQWNSNFSTVCSLSALWNQSFTIIPTVTSYLSANNVTVSSLNVLTDILSGGNNLTNIIYDATKWDYYSLTLAGSAQLPYNKKANSFYRINANQFGLALPPNARLGDVIRIENTNNTNFLSVSAYPTFFTEYPQFVLLGTISPQQSRTYVYGTVSLFKPLFLGGGGGGSGGGTSQENTWFEFSTTDAHTSKSITDYDIGSLFSTVQSNSATNWDESNQILPTVTNHLSTNQVQISSLIVEDGLFSSGYFWKQYPAPNNNSWTSIAYGNGLFVAIANTNTITPNKIMTSLDGVNWTLRTVPVENNWVSICYGNGLFVAVANAGDDRRIITSSDGINWNSFLTGIVPIESVVYGNGTFVAVANWPTGTIGPASSIFASNDGILWNVVNSVPRSFRSITYGNGLFYAITPDNIFTSSNGRIFNSTYGLLNENLNDIVYGNGLFATVANNGSVWVGLADNTVPMTQLTSPNANFTNAKIYYAQGLFFIVSRDTGVWLSKDLRNWTRPRSNLTGNNFRCIAYGNGLFVILANNFSNNNNVFVSGTQNIINDYDFNPRYGNLMIYGNLTAFGGNSLQWNSTFSTLCSNSANWNFNVNEIQKGSSTFNTVCGLSSNWNSVYSTWQGASGFELSARNFINNNGLNWNSVYSQVCSLSTNWSAVYTYDNFLSLNSTNAVQNSAITQRIQNIESNLNLLVDPPNYIPPTASLTNFNIQTYEVGQFAVRTLNLNWNQNNAGSATIFQLFRNNIFQNQASVPFSFNVNEIVVEGTTTFKNVVSYNTGPILNNILGNPDTRNRILAGSVETTQSYVGRYIQFYGTVAAIPTNLRTLPLSSFDNVNTFSIQVTENNTVLAIPNSKSLILARTQNFQDVTNAFTLSATSVADANGVSRPYKRYVQTTSVPFNLRIDFTLA